MNKKAVMERISSTNNRRNNDGGRSMRDIHKLSDDNNGDLLAGFSWPPRSYTCSFCRREFRSAQALGGHMNVHRRDRARLRQSPPPPREGHHHFSSSSSSSLLNLNLDPITANPNPSYSPPLRASPPSPPPPSRKFPCFIPTLSPSLVPSSSMEMGKWSKVEGIPVNHHFVTNYRVKGYKSEFEVVMKKGEIAKLDLKIGFHEDLDLELRLGCT
ncbi:unnamed protein product [Cuscuta epithymum]|uniref:C2H2-type domain-containing protein n=1 Tax=Cuscuta epithymum TaxID=186058 RepID=A0AAV0DEE6_9ASTE|nr:unnamed protein product [Cuscuta epithymum]